MVSYNDYTIELPVDAAEAVRRLQRELRAAEHRLAEARREAVFQHYGRGRRGAQQHVAD